MEQTETTRLRAVFSNPFTGEDHTITIEAEDHVIDRAHLEAAKLFIKLKLREALPSEQIQANEFLQQKLEYLIVQLYQPVSFSELFQKLMKFKEHLYEIPEFKAVYDHYVIPESPKQKESRLIQCKECEGQYYIPSGELTTVGEMFFCHCPYCKSRAWGDIPPSDTTELTIQDTKK